MTALTMPITYSYEYLPDTHSVLPVDMVDVGSSQVWHDVCADSVLNWPIGHGVQGSYPLSE